MSINTRQQRRGSSVVTDTDLKIVDEAFADLETTTLRQDNPPTPLRADQFTMDSLPPYQELACQLAFQLQALDVQRQHLTQLLQALQPPGVAET